MAGHLTALKERKDTEPTAMPRLRAAPASPFTQIIRAAKMQIGPIATLSAHMA